MERIREGYLLSSGTIVYANRGILGLTLDNSEHSRDHRVLFEGYDGDAGTSADYSPEERSEIAVFMIHLWEKWATAEA